MIATLSLSPCLATTSCKYVSVCWCNSPSGREVMASISSTSFQIFGFSLPRYVGVRQSATIPVPLKWMRKDGVLERLSRPATMAWRGGRWSELPLSVDC